MVLFFARKTCGDPNMRALLVEDDLTASRGIVAMLNTAAMIVDAVDTDEEALELARLYDYDVVVLDLVLPDMEGYEVVRRLRAARVETPILILSGLARPQAKVKGFGMGADDFITKPFDRDELIARIQAVVRRTKGFAQPNLVVGPLVLNLGSREVTVAGTPVHLTGKEYAILELLTLRKGVVMTKEAFLNHLYGGMDEPEVKIIDVVTAQVYSGGQASRRRAIRCLGSLVKVWSRSQPCFLAVESSERITAKSLALASERNPPEIFCRSFIIRPSRSTRLLVKGTRGSVRKRSTSCFRVPRRSRRLWPTRRAGRPRRRAATAAETSAGCAA